MRQIVEGETRFSKIGAIGENASRAELAALDLKQLFLAMTEEVRIIIVKLADRLHNMRTLDSMPPHKQKKIADETLLVRPTSISSSPCEYFMTYASHTELMASGRTEVQYVGQQRPESDIWPGQFVFETPVGKAALGDTSVPKTYGLTGR